MQRMTVDDPIISIAPFSETAEVPRELVPDANLDWVGWATLALIVLSPLPFGSHRPLIWAIQAPLVVFLLIARVVKDRTSLEAGKVPLAAQLTGVLCVLLAIWIVFQIVPLPEFFDSLIAPEGIVARSLLGDVSNPLLGRTISIAPAMTLGLLVQMLTQAGVFTLALQSFGTPSRQRTFLVTVAAAGALYTLYAIGSWLQGENMVLWWKVLPNSREARGTFIYRNGYVVWTIIAACCAEMAVLESSRHQRLDLAAQITLTQRLVGYACIALTVVVLPMTQSREGIGFGLTAMLLLPLTWLLGRLSSSTLRWLLGFGLLLLALLIAAIFAATLMGDRVAALGYSMHERVGYYMSEWSGVMDRPWTGWGAGTFELVFPMLRAPTYGDGRIVDYAHCDYLQALLGLGIPGALLEFGIVGLLWVGCLRLTLRSRQALVARVAVFGGGVMLLSALFDLPFQAQADCILFFGVLGSGLSMRNRSDNEV